VPQIPKKIQSRIPPINAAVGVHALACSRPHKLKLELQLTPPQ
jgi:hypothetical protein